MTHEEAIERLSRYQSPTSSEWREKEAVYQTAKSHGMAEVFKEDCHQNRYGNEIPEHIPTGVGRKDGMLATICVAFAQR